jgi:hypothetical protein
MNTSEQINELATALAKAQSEMGSATKDAKNPHFKSSYATLASCINAALPVLSGHGIAVLQPTVVRDGQLYVCTRLVHSSGQWIESEYPVEISRGSGPQATGSGVTYARRYSLTSMIALATEDDDGEAAQSHYRQPQQPRQQPRQQQPQRREVNPAMESLMTGIDIAATKEELRAIGESAQQAKDKGDITQAELNKLRAQYKSKSEALS